MLLLRGKPDDLVEVWTRELRCVDLRARLGTDRDVRKDTSCAVLAQDVHVGELLAQKVRAPARLAEKRVASLVLAGPPAKERAEHGVQEDGAVRGRACLRACLPALPVRVGEEKAAGRNEEFADVRQGGIDVCAGVQRIGGTKGTRTYTVRTPRCVRRGQESRLTG